MLYATTQTAVLHMKQQKILNAAVHTSTSRILCLTAGEIALGNTSSSCVKRDRVPMGLTSYCSIDHNRCFLQYIASPSWTYYCL